MAGIFLHKLICTDCSPSIQSQTFAISYRGLGKKGFQRSRPTLLVWSSSSLPEIQPQWLQMPIFSVNKKFCWSFVCTLYLNAVVHTYHKKSPAHVFHLRMRQCVSWLTQLCSPTHGLPRRALQIEQVIICWWQMIMCPVISTLFKKQIKKEVLIFAYACVSVGI